MKRDMDLIRLLLLQVEGEEKPDLKDVSEEQQVYHMTLLIEAGLVKGHAIDDSRGQPAGVIVQRLTWQGHEFLDVARNSSIWKTALDRIKSAGVTIGLPVLQEILTSLAKKQLKLE